VWNLNLALTANLALGPIAPRTESDFFRPRGLTFTPLRRPRGYVGTKTIYISILTDLLVLSNGLILSNEDLELPVILTFSLNLRSSIYRDLYLTKKIPILTWIPTASPTGRKFYSSSRTKEPPAPLLAYWIRNGSSQNRNPTRRRLRHHQGWLELLRPTQEDSSRATARTASASPNNGLRGAAIPQSRIPTSTLLQRPVWIPVQCQWAEAWNALTRGAITKSSPNMPLLKSSGQLRDSQTFC
jgi:hypothetical protein